MSTNKKAPLSRKQKIVAFSALSATLLVGGGLATSALLSDGGTTTINVASGNIDFQLQGDSSPVSKTITLDDVNGLQPGDTFTKTITVSNEGSLPLKYDLKSASVGEADKPLGAAIKVNVTAAATDNAGVDSTDVTVQGQSLNAIDLGAPVIVGAGKSKDITVSATWVPGASDNALQKKTANTVLTFTAEQSRGSEAK